MKIPLRLLVPAFAALLAACGAPVTDPAPVVEDPPPAPADTTPPTVTLPQREFEELKDTVQLGVMAADDVGLAKIELFAGESTTPVATVSGVPFNIIPWDTTNTPDGLYSLVARATDTSGNTADSAPLRAIVLNHGVLAADLGPRSDNMTIPSDLSGELDHKHHWNNPANIHTIVAILQFTTPAGQSEWNVGLSVGTGECPDSGEIIGPEVFATTGPIVVTAHPTGAQIATGLHFAHLRPTNATEHAGQSLPHNVKVYLFE